MFGRTLTRGWLVGLGGWEYRMGDPMGVLLGLKHTALLCTMSWWATTAVIGDSRGDHGGQGMGE